MMRRIAYPKKKKKKKKKKIVSDPSAGPKSSDPTN